MVRPKTSERHIVRDAAIVGAAVATGVAAAALGVRHAMRERAVRPDLDVDWDMQPRLTKLPEGEKVDLSEHGKKKLKHHLAVLSLHGAELDARIEEDVAVQLAIAIEGKDGAWHTGVLAGTAEERLIKSPRDPSNVVLAVRLGNQALEGGLHVGVLNGQGTFTAVKAEIEQIAVGTEIKHEYPGIAVMTPPPEDLRISVNSPVPVTNTVIGGSSAIL